MTGRSWWLAAGAVVAAVGGVFVVLGLESADHVSSGIGAAAGVLGLIAGAVGARRTPGIAPAPTAAPAPTPVSDPGREAAAPITMTATALDQARIYQAARDQHITHD